MNIYRAPDGFRLLAATYTLPPPAAASHEALTLRLQRFWRLYVAVRLFWFGSLLMCARPFFYHLGNAVADLHHSFGAAGVFWGVVFVLPLAALILWLAGTYGLVRVVLLGNFERVKKVTHYWLSQKHVDRLANRQRFRKEIAAWSLVLQRTADGQRGDYWMDVAHSAGLPPALAKRRVRFIRAMILVILTVNGVVTLWLLGLPRDLTDWLLTVSGWLAVSVYSVPDDCWALFTKKSPRLAAYVLTFKYAR